MIYLNDFELSLKIAQKVNSFGGKAYFVGGFVRDRLMGKESSDIDIEIHGIKAEKLSDILSEFGNVLSYGKSFGIFSVEGYGVDIALPRTEKPTGKGHRDFAIHSDPFLGEEEASRRRDFTVNALMQDVLSGEVLDFFGGKADLEKGIIRHVDDKHFGEDPLRVLRGAQFASRLDFDTDERTLEIYKKTDLSLLSPERVMSEMSKALLQGIKPSVFFETLKNANKLKTWFGELEALIGIEQNPKYHAEGDAWTHTMMVLDEAAKIKDKTSNPLGFMLCALCHDFGKAVTTSVKNGVIHAYNHETEGLPITEKFLKRLTNEKELIKYTLGMCALHMKPHILAGAKSSVKATNRMFDCAPDPDDLIYIAKADALGKLPKEDKSEAYDFLTERLTVYKSIMSKPHVSATDLMERGVPQGKILGEMLDYAHKLRLAGVEKDDALKQCLRSKKNGT